MRWYRRSMGAGLALLAGCLFAMPGLATEINGQVVDRDNVSQPRVRVDFLGATSRVVLTNTEGRFTVTLPAGTYKVRVSLGSRRVESTQLVKDAAKQELELRVDW